MDEEQKIPFEERWQTFASNAINVAPIIAALSIAVWWIFFGTIKITTLELSIAEKIGLTICTIAMALSYRKLLSSGGFKDAKKTKEWKESKEAYTNAKKVANPHRSEIREFTKDICFNNLRDCRRKNLENNGLKYENIFNELGQLIDLNYKHNHYSKKRNPTGYRWHQIRIIYKCVKMKIHLPDLFDVENAKYFGLSKPESERRFKLKNDTIHTITTSILAFFSTSIMFAWIGFSKGSFIYALFQIALWTGIAILHRIKNYNYIINKIIPQMEDYTSILDEYMSLSEERKQHYVDIIVEKENRKFRKLIPQKTSEEMVADLEKQKAI